MKHLVDKISLGDIVKIREDLIKLQAEGKEIFRFESGGPSFKPSKKVQEQLISAMNQGKTEYVPNAGIPELRKAVVAKLQKDDINTSLDNVFVTNGAMHGLFCVFQILLEAQDEVIIPDPMWSEIADNIELAGGIPIRVDIFKGYTASNIAKHITNRTRAIFINSPHNPTGKVLETQDLHAIFSLAESHGLKIISDEAYEHINFTREGSPTSIYHCSGVWDPKKLISVYSFSKSYAMPGLRLGYTVIEDPTLHEAMQKILRCTTNGINSVTQWAGVAALDYDEYPGYMTHIYKLRANYMYEALRTTKLYPIMPEGAFYMWCRPAGGTTMCKHLLSHGIGAVPGLAFGPDHFNALRLSFACNTDMVLKGTKLIQQVL